MDVRVERAILEITRRYREPLSLTALAQAVGLSSFHFHRLFLQATGETPKAYLRRIRLSHADHLMAALPDASLLAIALESGFASPSCFSRAYRQAYGHPPSAVRTEMQNRGPSLSELAAGRLALCHLPTRQVAVQQQPLDEMHLTAYYRALAATVIPSDLAVLGLFVDAPFHVPRPLCRYFVAREEVRAPGDEHSVLEIPGGYYARLMVTGDLDALGRALFSFHDDVLVPSNYALASTLFFERLLLAGRQMNFDYRQCQREVFIKVRPKGELVI